MTAARRSAGPFLVSMTIWLLAAIGFTYNDRLALLRPPIPQLILVGLSVAAILIGRFHTGFREWMTGVNLRGFVAFHLTRFVGLVFLVMNARGHLTGEFAITAGWGDIIAALGALVLVLMSKNPMDHKGALRAWNTFGIFDILLVVATAARIGVRSPEEILPLLRFPMSLVLMYVVPVIIASHVLIFWRMAKTSR